MAKVTITIEDGDDDGDVVLGIKSKPAINLKSPLKNTVAQFFAAEVFEYAINVLGKEKSDESAGMDSEDGPDGD